MIKGETGLQDMVSTGEKEIVEECTVKALFVSRNEYRFDEIRSIHTLRLRIRVQQDELGYLQLEPSCVDDLARQIAEKLSVRKVTMVTDYVGKCKAGNHNIQIAVRVTVPPCRLRQIKIDHLGLIAQTPS
jgi:hypothetical protein